MLFDCFLYSGEEIIDLRFKLHAPKIDKFIIVEFNKTFQGHDKKFLFQKKKYAKYKKKIIYIKNKISKDLYFKSAWEMEFYQRNFILNCIKNFNEKNFIILSDVDEILNIKKIKLIKNQICIYECLNFRFYGNYLNKTNPTWPIPLTTTIKISKQIGMQNLRNSYKAQKKGSPYDIYRKKIKYTKTSLIKNSGWHFSSLKNSKKNLIDIILDKHKKYAHTEFNNKFFNNKKILKYKINNGYDIYNDPSFWCRVNIKYHNNQIYSWMSQKNLLIKTGNIYNLEKIIKSNESDSIFFIYIRKKLIFIFYKFLNKILSILYL